MSWACSLFFVGVTMFASVSAGPLAKNSRICASALVKLSRIKNTYFKLTRKWIRHNALIGYERTYTSPILENLFPSDDFLYLNIPEPFERSWANLSRQKKAQTEMLELLQSIKTRTGKRSITAEQATEIVKFFRGALGATSVVMHVGKQKLENPKVDLGSKPHMQPFTFEVVTRWGTNVFVVLEQACIEVNQEPVARDRLRAHWDPLEKAANRAKFFSNSQTGESGGGGAHLNLGWRNAEQNLWVLRPDLLAEFLELPLQRPEMLFLLRSEEDFGRHGSAPTPFEGSTTTAMYMYEFLLRLKSLHLEGASPSKVKKFFKQNLEAELRNHNQYISLKHLDQENPWIEIRMQASLASLDQMEAAADLWLEALYRSRHNYAISTYKQWDHRFDNANSINPLEMLDRIRAYLDKLQLSDSTRQALLDINQIDQTDQAFYNHIKIWPPTPARILRAATYLPSENAYSRVAIEWTNDSYPLDVDGEFIYSDRVEKFSSKNGVIKGTFSRSFLSSGYILALVYDRRTKTLIDRFAIESTPDEFGGAQIEFGLPVEHAIHDDAFDQKMFRNGFWRLAGQPVTNQEDGNPVARDKKSESIFNALPELRTKFAMRQKMGNGPSHLKLSFELPSRPIAVDVVNLYVNGKNIPFKKIQQVAGLSIESENLYDHFPIINSVANAVYFHVMFRQSTGILNHFFAKWDLEHQELDFTKAGPMADKSKSALTMLGIKENTPTVFGPLDAPESMKAFLNEFFNNYEAIENLDKDASKPRER